MYIYIYMYMYVYIYIYNECTNIHIYIYICVYVYIYIKMILLFFHGSWTESNGFRWRISLNVAKPRGCGRWGAGQDCLLEHSGPGAQLFETT